MLGHLELRNVGPAPKLEIDFAERLNLITGDNGLGKSFLLDVAWWALTQTWAREMAWPAKGVHEAEIWLRVGLDARGQPFALPFPGVRWNRRSQGWEPANESEPGTRGIVLVRFQLHAAPGLPVEVVASIDCTIDRLRLNDEACKQTRADWCEAYWAGHLGLSFIERRFPLLARELRRQDRLVPSDRLR